jgi:two-component system, OmpR family, response regulator
MRLKVQDNAIDTMFDKARQKTGNTGHPSQAVELRRRHMPSHHATRPLSPRILIVDDDGQIRQLLAAFLRDNGFDVALARDGVEMREAVRKAPPDLVVLDLMLPGADGLELCRELRRASAIPVIMLTARGDDTDRIIGLEVGADDYLAKPFNPRELLARIRAVLRRSGGETGETTNARNGHVFDGWRVDLLRRELTNPDGALVDLSGAEFDMLLAFLESPNRVLTRERLLETARNRQADVFDRSVDVLVSRLRRKLESGSADAHPLIKTVRGAGYLFLPKVERS